MSTSVREIIVEALDRANIVSRRQGAQGHIIEGAFQLLKGIVSKFNNDNLLSFTQNEYSFKNPKEFNHIWNGIDTEIVPENSYITFTKSELPTPSEDNINFYGFTLDDLEHFNRVQVIDGNYTWVALPLPTNSEDYRIQEFIKYIQMKEIVLPSVAKVQSVFARVNDSTIDEYFKLNFQPFNDFDRCNENAEVYTLIEKAEGEFILRLKKMLPLTAYEIKIVYNKALKIDIDTTLSVPDAYIELLTVALTHKLALKYPRLDANQMQRLENELISVTANIKTPKAENRMVLRDERIGNTFCTPNQLMSGSFWR